MAQRDQRGIGKPASTIRPISGRPDTSVPGNRGIVNQPGAEDEDNLSSRHDGDTVMGIFGGGKEKAEADDPKE